MASTISLHYITAGGLQLPVYSLNTLIVGSGAAALNAALHLHEFGVRNIAIATAQMGGGTSNLSGSDKQTYYKLGLSADHTDSIYDLARTLTMAAPCTVISRLWRPLFLCRSSSTLSNSVFRSHTTNTAVTSATKPTTIPASEHLRRPANIPTDVRMPSQSRDCKGDTHSRSP